MENLKNATIKKNGRKTKAKSIFVKELNWKVILPSKVVNYLRHKVEEVTPFKNFKFEIGLYFLSLISSVPARKKGAEYLKGFIPLSSKLLEKAKYNYKKYYDYFVSIGIVEKISYSTDRNRSNSFRYNYKNIKMEGLDHITFESFDFSKLKNKSINYQPFNVEAQETCSHLLEWLDHGLHLDFKLFLQESIKRFEINKFEDERILENKMLEAKCFYYNGFDFHLQNWRAKRNEESDNRLHTNLTNLDKDIRKYVKYQGETIKSLDLKNSQPYFLILFIEEILKQGRNSDYKNKRLNLICNKIYDGFKCTMFKRLSQCANNESFMAEFNLLKNSVLEGQYYEFLGGVFDEISPLPTGDNGIEIYEGKFFNRGNKRMETLRFSSKRNLMKKVSMQLLYTPLTKPSEYYIIFKSKFPLMCEFMEILKTTSDDKESFKKFPKLLQHYEADCILDFVTKKVSEKYPDMPLFTIHDSIATTSCWFEILEEEVHKLLVEYSNGMPPLLEGETWGIDYPYENVA